MASAGIGMAIVALDGTWLDVNPALGRMLGYPAEALVGKPTQAFSHLGDLGVTPSLLQSLPSEETEDVVETERRYLTADGSTLDVMVNAALMRDASGTPQYFIAQFNDVTEMRQAERELRKLNASLEQCVRERSAALELAGQRLETYAYGVSHDLRAPLRTIDGFARHLERTAGTSLDEAAQDSLRRIRAATLRMGDLIDSLLELTRAGRAELRPERVDVSLLAEWVGAELQDAHQQRSAHIAVQPGLEVIGDERLLKVLFTQLLRNAWQFSASRPQVQVEIEGERDAGVLQLSVRDHGIGFSMDYADKLFEPFQRLHGSEEGAGNGIGLSIAHQVVARHGGRIWAESAPGQGAAFHMTLHDLHPLEATTA